ncbi:hypothetical protein [Halorubrum tibetense]|uniref:Uncharacterized protein n=1 Tax=Halorubrum tibetense TaxID=175631 RepID=A0ABD5SGC0_9EURY
MLPNRWKTAAGILIVGFVFVSSIPISYLRYGSVGLESISIIATSVLTLGLVVLYYEQHSVLKAQQEPHLEITEFDMFNELQSIDVRISNFGGGPATSLKLVIEFYDLDGTGPLDTASGLLRRIETDSSVMDHVTLSSSVRPSEVGIEFEITSESVIPMGSTSTSYSQRSLGRIIRNNLDERDVLYGKVKIEYESVFSEGVYEADFSLKFTKSDGELKYETFSYLPWNDEYAKSSLGG